MFINRFFWKLSGDDYNIINKCSKPTRNRFTAIGCLVAVIFILCFISSYFAFTKLFQNNYIGVTVGLFFGWMITNIYLLLLYTLSKTSYPFDVHKSDRHFSIIIRLVFIAFIAVVVSKPIESIVFSNILNVEIEDFKKDKLNTYTLLTEQFFNEEISNLNDNIIKERALDKSIDVNQIKVYQSLILSKEKERDALINSMKKLVDKSDYYIQGVSILNSKYPVCWSITLVVVLIFLYPANIKVFIKDDTIFYKTKYYIENKLVKYEYELFKEKYNQILRNKFDKDFHFSESYTNPPFNTIRKKDDRKVLKESDLLDSIYNA